jgi:hypothetical protein
MLKAKNFRDLMATNMISERICDRVGKKKVWESVFDKRGNLFYCDQKQGVRIGGESKW